MAGFWLEIRKVRETDEEVTYEFNSLGKTEINEFRIDKKTGLVRFSADLDEYRVEMAWYKVWKLAGKPEPPTPDTVWPETASYIA